MSFTSLQHTSIDQTLSSNLSIIRVGVGVVDIQSSIIFKVLMILYCLFFGKLVVGNSFFHFILFFVFIKLAVFRKNGTRLKCRKYGTLVAFDAVGRCIETDIETILLTGESSYNGCIHSINFVALGSVDGDHFCNAALHSPVCFRQIFDVDWTYDVMFHTAVPR